MNKLLAATTLLVSLASCGGQRQKNLRAEAQAPAADQAPRTQESGNPTAEPGPGTSQASDPNLLGKMAGCFGLKETDVEPAEELTAKDVEMWCSTAQTTQFAAGIQDLGNE